MKAVLTSIQPKWCELIASGKKSVEFRKTKPKLDTPFKCYIYQTKKHWVYKLLEKLSLYQGKVIGEFVCDRIQKYECEFVNDDCYEEIASVSVDEDGDEMGFIEWSNDSGVPYEKTDPYQESCVEYNELKKYIGLGFGVFYGWHISDLVIYEQPKDLIEFSYPCKKDCDTCKYNKLNPWASQYELIMMCQREVSAAPQSWCYVEELR